MASTNKGGRSPIEFNSGQIEKVEELAESLTCEQIADYFGISHVTFSEVRKRQPEVSFAYKRGRSKVIDEIASSLIKNAKAGDTTSQVFYLKTQAGWSEKQLIETKDTTPQKRFSIEVKNDSTQN